MVVIFVYEPDLIFASKFEGFSHIMGINFRVFSDLNEFIEAAHVEMPRALILDLDLIPPNRLTELLHAGPLLAYYSHINSTIAQNAKQIGVELVVARSAFVSNVQSLINHVLNLKKQAP